MNLENQIWALITFEMFYLKSWPTELENFAKKKIVFLFFEKFQLSSFKEKNGL